MRAFTRSILVLALVAVLCSAMSVQAQQARGPRGPRGPSMAPEQTQAVWTLQANHAAGKLKLSKEQTTKLVDAYKKARASYNEALRKAREEARASADTEDRQAVRQAMREGQQKVTKAETEKFAKAVGAILDKEKTKLALKHLGTFSGSWDRMVHTIAGLKLGKEKQAKALDIVSAYVVESTAAREKAVASGDRQSMREVSQKQRAKLNEAMGKVLSEEELAKWTKANARRGTGRRGTRPPGGGVGQ